MSHWKPRFAQVTRGLATALVAGGLGLAALGAHANDDPPGRVGRLGDMSGQVWLLENGQGEWQTATRNRPVTTADRIATDNGGRAELQIGSTTVRLDQASDLEVTRLDDDRIELTLHGGTASLRVREPEVAREVQITTPEGRFQPRGPGLFRIDRTERGSLAGSSQGEIDFESADSQLTLRPGQRAELWFDGGDRRTHYSWSTPANDPFEQWVRRDDARDERYAARHPISPEMTGADDLYGNGQWSTHPEYGAIWYPTTVVAGWAPYRYGRWAWVNPWGWTWVDDAPWGFAPFHYGRWMFWGGRWCWAPGTYVRRPVYAPAMVAWVGGPHVNVSINMGGGQPVGWVPLAPRETYYPAYRVSNTYVQQVNITHVHVTQVVRPQNRPVMYTNSGVAGGITMVSSDVLTRRQAVATAARPADDEMVRAVRSQRGVVQAAPPVPANASYAPRVVPAQGGSAAAVPRPGQPRPPLAGTLNSDDGRGASGRPGNQAAQRPSAGGVPQGGVQGQPGQPAQAAPGTTRTPVSPVGQQPQGQGEPRQQPAVPRPPLGNNGQGATPREGGLQPPQQQPQQHVPGFPAPREPRENPRITHPMQPAQPAPQPNPPMQQVQPQHVPQQPPQGGPREDRQQERAQERQDRQEQRRQHEKQRDNNRDGGPQRQSRAEGANRWS
ncbi:MAG: DUF6600 domain-containing protein [Burkholderiaceae bacterium]